MTRQHRGRIVALVRWYARGVLYVPRLLAAAASGSHEALDRVAAEIDVYHLDRP